MNMLRRLGHALYALLVLLDIVACFIWIAPLYVVGLASRPTGRQMISTYVGRAASNGHRWARRVARLIDALFEMLDGRPDHCRRMTDKYAGFAD